MIPGGVANYIYSVSTRNSNLWNHLYKYHTEDYNRVVQKNQWKYKLSTQLNDAASHKNAGDVCDWALPQFSPSVFLEHLVHFIAADDQVSLNNLVFFHALTCFKSICVVECLEFRQLCMVLHETLVDANIPHHDKMREAIVYHWKKLFEELKADLSVSLPVLSSLSTNFDQ